jgi:hypothetical protein
VAALILIGASPVAMFLVAMCWSSMLGWLSKTEAASGQADDRSHQISQQWLLPSRGDLGLMPGADCVSDKGSV